MSDPLAPSSTEVAALGGGRFQVLERLGSGGMGVVYAAWDQERGRRVAVKTLRAMSAERLVLFKNEFRSLCDVGHPNLVTLHELCEVGGEWLVSMELVAGQPLLEWLRAGGPGVDESMTTLITAVAAGTGAGDSIGFACLTEPDGRGRVDEDRLRDALAQIVHGLDALHRRGKVHRDVKPSNVLVADDGRVVILDFGLVGDIGAVERAAMGTPGYMAPEQAAGQPIGPASDWYAVGAVLYQVLTGRLPFLGSSDDVLRQKQVIDPAAPELVAPSSPRWASGLAMALLRRDPAERAGAAAILAAIGAPPLAGATGAGFVGRTAELAALDDALAAAAAGPVTLRLSGASGIGKTTTVAEWTRRLGPSVVVLAGRCYERESVPYKAVDAVIDALARALPAEPALADDRAAAGVVFAVLRAHGPSRAALGDPAQERQRAFVAVRRLVAALAGARRLVIAIDDVQWADRDGLAALAAVLAPPSAPPVLVVLTERADASEARTVLPWAGDVRELTLGALADDDAVALARRSGADAEVSARFAAQAGGHPLLIAELARGGAAVTQRMSLEEALWHRVLAEPPAARAVLAVAALAGRPIAADVVAAVAEVGAAEWLPLVAALRDRDLVRSGGGDTLDVFHGRLRDAIVPRLAAAERTAIHRRLAEALEARADRDALAVASHWLEAGEPGRARGLLGQAAAAAEQALAFDHAAGLYRMLLPLTGDGGPHRPTRERVGAEPGPDTILGRHAVQVALGGALANAGRGVDAADELLRAAAGGGPDALDLRRRAGEQLLRSGHVDRGLDVITDVLAAVGLRLPATPLAAGLRVLWSQARLALRGLVPAEVAADPRRASEAPPADARARRRGAGPFHHSWARLDVGWSASVGLSMVDTVRGGEILLRTLREALDAGDLERTARALAVAAGHQSAGGTSYAARSAAMLAQATALAERAGSVQLQALCAGAGGVIAYLEGRFAAAHALSGAALDRLAGVVGATWERDTSAIVEAWAAVYLGRFAALGEQLPRAIREADDRDDRYLATSLRSGTMVLVPLALGDPARARAEANAAIATWSHRHFLHQHWDDLYGQGEIDLYEGDAAGCLARLERGWRALRDNFVLAIQISRAEAWNLRARAALAAATRGGDRKRGIAMARKGARALADLAPWTAGLAELLRAGAAAASGDPDSAVDRLERAIAALDGADMALHAAAARHRLAPLLGGSAGAAHAAAAAGYAVRERVADLGRLTDALVPFPPR